MSARPHISRYIDSFYVTGLLIWMLGFGGGYLLAYMQPDFACKHLNDFEGFYSAARISLSAERARLYEPALQKQWLSEVQVGNGCSPIVGNERFSEQPPMFFAVYMPFALLPFSLAFALSSALFVVLGAAALLVLAQSCGMSRRQSALLIFGCAASGVACYGMELGQPNWLLVAIVGAYVFCFLKGKDLPAGLLLGGLVFKPQYALFFVVPAACDRRLRMLAAAAATVAVEIFACGLWFGFPLLFSYPQMLWHRETLPGNQANMVSLRGLLNWWVPADAGNWLAAVIAGLGMLLVVLVCARTRRQERLWPLAIAITTIVSLLLGPHNFPYDCVILVVPAALLLSGVSIGDALRLREGDQRLLQSLFIVYPLLTVGLLYACPLLLRGLLFALLHLLLLVSLLKLWWKGSTQLADVDS